MAVRRCRKEDLRRIARATGGTLVSSLANLEGEESFESTLLGNAEEVVQERISDDELILIKGTKVVNSASIVLRGANDYMLDEMERALHDTLSIIKRTLESGSVVPGGGAVETALSIYLENFATSLVSADSVFVLPVLLKENLNPGFAGATRDCRVCRCAAGDSQNACCKRSQRFDRTCCKTSFLSQRCPKSECWRSQEGLSPVRPRPVEWSNKG